MNAHTSANHGPTSTRARRRPPSASSYYTGQEPTSIGEVHDGRTRRCDWMGCRSRNAARDHIHRRCHHVTIWKCTPAELTDRQQKVPVYQIHRPSRPRGLYRPRSRVRCRVLDGALSRVFRRRRRRAACSPRPVVVARQARRPCPAYQPHFHKYYRVRLRRDVFHAIETHAGSPLRGAPAVSAPLVAHGRRGTTSGRHRSWSPQ